MTKWALGIVIAAVLITGTFAFMPVEEASSSGAESDLIGIPTGGMMLRGVSGAGIPWAIAEGDAEFGDGNSLEVVVEGLVLTGGPLVGKNPISAFFATLSCIDASGTTVNINTSTVPASMAGDAEIEDVLTGVPSPCVAPIVIVRADLHNLIPANPSGPDPTDPWIAASGF